MKGKVYLVGAGPGDPELITVKGARLLSEAEVVVYDFLANQELLKLAPEWVKCIYVGKKAHEHSMSQEDINTLLCELAIQGFKVVRLKGGDPFIFGRGGEEASALSRMGITFEIIPGVTSAVAAPAYAGIPITDRRYTTEVAFITGHEKNNKLKTTIKWSSLVGIGTLVFLMGVKNLSEICCQLLAYGSSVDTPAAFIYWGSTPKQKIIIGKLNTLPALVNQDRVAPPAIIVVGQVVELSNELRWFDCLPLFGRRILVTRTRMQANKLTNALKHLGADVIEVPTIVLKPPYEIGSLLTAVERIEFYDWILFTSVNGVEIFFTCLRTVGKDVRSLSNLLVGSIGPATTLALKECGVNSDLVATSYVAEGLLKGLSRYKITGAKMLLPRGEDARNVLPETLCKWGAHVEIVPTYRTEPPLETIKKLNIAMRHGVDIIAFTASSTVINFMKLFDKNVWNGFCQACASGKVIVAAIGPITTKTAKQLGLTVHIQPSVYTIEALIKALAGYLKC